MSSGQVSDFRDSCLLIRHGHLICSSCSSGQRFAFSFLPTSPRDDAVAVQLTLPPDGCVEDLHLQVGAPCRAHNKKKAGPNDPAFVVTNAACLVLELSPERNNTNKTGAKEPYCGGDGIGTYVAIVIRIDQLVPLILPILIPPINYNA